MYIVCVQACVCTESSPTVSLNPDDGDMLVMSLKMETLMNSNETSPEMCWHKADSSAVGGLILKPQVICVNVCEAL